MGNDEIDILTLFAYSILQEKAIYPTMVGPSSTPSVLGNKRGKSKKRFSSFPDRFANKFNMYLTISSRFQIFNLKEIDRTVLELAD